MKAGTRALGVADSYTHGATKSTIVGAVVRADRVFDGMVCGHITVGGTDSTARITELWQRIDRPDVQYVFLAGIAPAWYNVIDLPEIAVAVDRPVISVSFEESDGLAPALRDAFEGRALAERLSRYERQPSRQRISVNGEQLFVRAVGLTTAESKRVVRAFTPEGGRPEPLRVAHTAAAAVDTL
ncbi:endonuclease dU [Halocatena pleomorpha]|uniref:UPF0215 protein EIK79_13435 n=1 Tax=Halocatena pleomorpha TaxID=1785090 RepID=A0A3P3R6R0_9EURY|nr:DUF99 family protein [Halocatena pleomorpha]RRJ29136.1 DUF99 family protein [Halocatena pleomorpha]